MNNTILITDLKTKVYAPIINIKLNSRYIRKTDLKRTDLAQTK